MTDNTKLLERLDNEQQHQLERLDINDPDDDLWGVLVDAKAEIEMLEKLVNDQSQIIFRQNEEIQRIKDISVDDIASLLNLELKKATNGTAVRHALESWSAKCGEINLSNIAKAIINLIEDKND